MSFSKVVASRTRFCGASLLHSHGRLLFNHTLRLRPGIPSLAKNPFTVAQGGVLTLCIWAYVIPSVTVAKAALGPLWFVSIDGDCRECW